MRYFFFCVLIIALSLQSFAQANVILEGKIKNYEKYAGRNDYVLIIINSLAFGDQIKYTEKVHTDGSFIISFPKRNPQDIMFEYKDMVTLYVKAGDKLHIEFDADSMKKSIAFKGEGAKVNTEIQQYYLEKKLVHNEELKNSSADAYKRSIYAQLKSDSLFYESFISKNNVSNDFKNWAKWEILYGCAYNLMRYTLLDPSGKNASRFPQNYYDFFGRFPLNNPEAAVSSRYGDYLYEYDSYFISSNSHENISLGFPEIAKALLDTAPDLTKTQRKRLTKFANKNASDKLSIGDAIHFLSMRKLIEKNDDLLSEKLQGKALSKMMDLYINKTDGLLRDLLLSNFLYTSIDGKYIIGIEPSIRKYEQTVNTTYLKQDILDYYHSEKNKFYNTKPPVSANLASTPKSSAQSVLEKIINKYPGKVVYVDFWATWCGPCRAQMPNSAKLRTDLKGLDVVFVYLGVQSVESTWKAVIAQLNMQGENYLLTDNEYKVLSERFRITGIPHYVLVDKTGRVEDGRAKGPDDPNLKKEILALLSKQL